MWPWATYYTLVGCRLQTHNLQVNNITDYWPVGQCSHKHIDMYIFYVPLQGKFYL